MQASNRECMQPMVFESNSLGNLVYRWSWSEMQQPDLSVCCVHVNSLPVSFPFRFSFSFSFSLLSFLSRSRFFSMFVSLCARAPSDSLFPFSLTFVFHPKHALSESTHFFNTDVEPCTLSLKVTQQTNIAHKTMIASCTLAPSACLLSFLYSFARLFSFVSLLQHRR